MSEEEKKAIEYLKARLYGNEGCELIDVAQSDLRIIIKLADRVLKDDKIWQEIYDEQEENIREKNNKICEYEFIIEKQQKEIEKSHQEENGKLRVEFEKVYEDNLTLANELEQEKEKNKKLEKYKTYYEEMEEVNKKFIAVDKIKELLENETIEDIENLLEEK